jgi:hypothetical protein
MTKQQLLLFGKFVSHFGPLVAMTMYDHPGRSGVWTIFEAGGSKQQSFFAGSPAVLALVRMVALPKVTADGKVSVRWIWTLQIVMGGGMMKGPPPSDNVCSGQSLASFDANCQALFSRFSNNYVGTAQKLHGMPVQQ